MTWRERIQEARARGRFTEQDIVEAVSSWGTCAVGEQVDRYGADVIRHSFVALAPLDPILLQLGGTGIGGFGWAVSRHQIKLAEERLDQIEDRALQLKREAVQ